MVFNIPLPSVQKIKWGMLRRRLKFVTSRPECLNLTMQKSLYTHQGIQLTYYVSGKGHALLFLPGAIKAEIYRKNIAYLAQTYKVIIPEVPGFGDSTVPQTVWGFTEYAEFFSAFMKEQQVSTFSVIGHSFGGGIALEMATMNRGINKMVLYGAMGVASRKSILRFGYDMFIRKTLTDVFYHNEIHLKAIMLNNGLSTIIENSQYLGRLFRIAYKALRTSFSPLKKVTVPTLLVWGTKDELFPVENAYTIQTHILEAEVKVIQGSHDWCILEPEKFGKIVTDFLL